MKEMNGQQLYIRKYQVMYKCYVYIATVLSNLCLN